jgi:hypothetical protein
MNIPTPAVVKKQIDEKKEARKVELASELTISSRTNGKLPSTKSVTPSGSSRSTKSSSKKTVSESASSTSTTGKKPSTTKSSPSDGTRKQFVRQDHLTQRPLRDNEGLQSLKKELEKPARGQFKRQYRSNARQSGKASNIKKESN